MTTPFIHDGKRIDFGVLPGEVVKHTKTAKTYVSSSGGGGYVGRYGGYIEAPTIRSSVVVDQEIWVRTKDGQEHPVMLSSLDIPIREGQAVSIIYGGGVGREKNWIALVNHDAKRWWGLVNYGRFYQEHLMTGSGFYLSPAGAMLFWMILSVCFGGVINIASVSLIQWVGWESFVRGWESSIAGLAALCGAVLAWMIVAVNRQQRARADEGVSAFRAHVEILANYLMACSPDTLDLVVISRNR